MIEIIKFLRYQLVLVGKIINIINFNLYNNEVLRNIIVIEKMVETTNNVFVHMIKLLKSHCKKRLNKIELMIEVKGV